MERARAEAVFELRLSGPLLQGSSSPQEAVETFQQELGVHAILVQDGQTYDSDPGSGVVVPAELRAIAADGQIGYDRIDVGGVPTLLVGGPTPDRGAELYFAFPETGINEDLRELATVLTIGWVGDRRRRVRPRAGRCRPYRYARGGRGVGETLHLRRLP